MSSGHSTNANFYLIFSRAWELFFGAIIAFFPLSKMSISRLYRESLSMTGLIMIVWSIVFFDDQTPFPSFYTLMPVLGTCLIIAFADTNSFVSRFLSNKVFVFIGLISYSLYLWHQPLFAFLRMKTVGDPTLFMFIAAIVVAFIFALISWKFVEAPFRNRVLINRVSVFTFSGVSIVSIIIVGLAGHFNHGFEQRFDQLEFADTMKPSPFRERCHTKGVNYLKPSEACTYFGKKISWASFGDSHTVELAYALATRLKTYDTGLVQLSFSSCAPALMLEVKRLGCSNWIKESLDFLEKNKNIQNILLGFRYSSFLYGKQLKTYPNPPNQNPATNFTDSFLASSSRDLRELYWESLEEIILRLSRAGKKVHILYPIPELPLDINAMVTPFSIFGGAKAFDLDRTTTAMYYFTRNEFILSKLDALPYGDNLHAIRPFDIMCSDKFCPAVKGKNALYFDDNHLSLFGGQLVIDSIDIEEQKRDKIFVATVTDNSSGPM
jgi:hypothetical protein